VLASSPSCYPMELMGPTIQTGATTMQRTILLPLFAGGLVFATAALAPAGQGTPAECAERQDWVAARFAPEPATNTVDLPFAFRYGDQSSRELLKQWKVKQTRRELDANRREFQSVWNDPQSSLEVRCVVVEYADFPTVEWTLYFQNRGSNDTAVLSQIQALDLQLERSAPSEFVLNYNAGDDCTPHSYEPRRLTLAPKADRQFASVGGRPTHTALPYFNLEWSGHGLIAVIGWPGQWAARFTRDATAGLHLSAGQELTHFQLHPGESARSPLVVLQFWQGDRFRAQNLWRRWMLAHNTPHLPGGRPPRPILSSCSGGFFPGLRTSEAGERQFINAFSAAGVKLNYWWIDAGWYPCSDWPQIGTWTPDPERYPRGFKPVSELARAKGMGLIVWFEPERVTPGTALYTQHPDWLLGADGGQKLLNLGHPQARRWLTDHVDGLLQRQGIDFYRQDFNIDPLPFWRANDAPDRQGLTEIHHVEGYLAYWDELRRRHPGLLIDSCASGGRRNDLETLRRAVPLLRSDYQAFDGNPDYAPGNQGHTYGLSSWLPYYGQGAYFTEREYVYSVRSYLSPALGLAVDVRKPGVDWPLIKRMADEWRSVADCMLGDFYPLTAYQLAEDQWMAWQFDLPEHGEGMVQSFRRAHSSYEIARLKLKGLDPAARYRLVDLDSPDAPQEMSGQDLMEKGLRIHAPVQPSARIIRYRRAN